MPSPMTVQFLPGYEHFSFAGNEPNDLLQKAVISAFKGRTKSDDRWLNYVQIRREEEEEVERQRLEAEENKRQLDARKDEIWDKITFWDRL